MQFETLQQAFHERARGERSVTFVESSERRSVVPVSELRDAALSMLGRLQRRGARPGHEVIVHVADNRAFLETFWACVLGGLVPVPVALGISDEHRLKLVRIFERLTSPLLVTDSATMKRIASFAEKSSGDERLAALRAATLVIDDATEGPGAPGEEHRAAPDDLAFIQFSSGSTSEPKGVMLTHANILTNIAAIVAGIELSSEDVCLSWMPLSHDMGLIGFHLTPLVNGTDHVIIPTDQFVRRPLSWMQHTDELGATVLCSPNFGYKHYLKALNRNEPDSLDLSRVRLVMNGAEPISVSLCNDFLDALARFGLRNETMYPVYGLAEASLAVTFPELGQGARSVRLERSALGIGDRVVHADDSSTNVTRFARVGRAIENCEVRITGTEGSSLPSETVGHVEIRGRNVTSGYYASPDATRAARRADGWLDTGDLGFLSPDGELVITGRHKDILFVNGQNFYPHDLEEILVRQAGIELGKVAVAGHRDADADADELLVFVIHKGDPADFVPRVGDIAAILNAQVGIDITHVIPVQRIPKTTSGKVQRHALIRSYVEGDYAEVLAAMGVQQDLAPESGATDSGEPAEGVREILVALCREVLPDRSVGPEDNLFEIGTSSVELAQLHEGIEKRFPGLVDITDLFEYPTVTELTKLLEQKLAESA